MSKKPLISKWLRKISRIVLWTVGILLVLVALVLVLIRQEKVQNYIVGKITSYVSDKTNTRVELGRIYISFSGNIEVENLFLDDKAGDTLLSSGHISVDLDLWGLLHNRLNIEKILIEDTRGSICRRSDSLFNFSFLLDAFADENSAPPDTASTPMEIDLGEFLLSNLSLSFNDSLAQNYLSTKIARLSVDMNEVNIPGNKFFANEIELSGFKFAMHSEGKQQSSEENSSLPDIRFHQIALNDIEVSMHGPKPDDSMSLAIKKSLIVAKELSLPESRVQLASFHLSGTSLGLAMAARSKQQANETPDSSTSTWKFSCDEITIDETNLNVTVAGNPSIPGFDPNHIDISDLNMQARNAAYSSESIRYSLKSLSFISGDEFELKDAHFDLSMDNRQTILKKLSLITNASEIHGDLALSYPSLGKIADMSFNKGLHLTIDDSHISTSDLIYWQHTLKDLGYFSAEEKTIGLETKIHGSFSDLKIDELIINTGNSRLEASGYARGLPEAGTAFYDFNIPRLSIYRQDLSGFIPIDKYGIPTATKFSGRFRGTLKNFNASLEAVSDAGSLEASLVMEPGKENYLASLKTQGLDLGYILRDTSLGRITLQASLDGSSFDFKNATSELQAHIASFTYNGYSYNSIAIDGHADNGTYNSHITLKDSNIVFELEASARLRDDTSHFKLTFDLKGADLKRLHLSEKDIRVSAQASADIRGNTMKELNGDAGITNLLVIQEGNNYVIDSLTLITLNEKGRSAISFRSPVIAADFDGSFYPGDIGPVIIREIDRHFHVVQQEEDYYPQDFTFNLVIRDHPFLRDVLLPGLEEFSEVDVSASMDSRKSTIAFDATIPSIDYSGFKVDDLSLQVSMDSSDLGYRLSLREIEGGSVQLGQTELSGTISNDEASIQLATLDSSGNNQLNLQARLSSLENDNYEFAIEPGGLYLNGEAWNTPPDNSIRFGKSGLLFNHFELSNKNQSISIHSHTKEEGKGIETEFQDFRLGTIFRLFQRDTLLAEGELNGKLSMAGNTPGKGMEADLQISNLNVKSTPVGNIDLHMQKIESRFDTRLRLAGQGNNLTIKGTIEPEASSPMNLHASIESLSLPALAAFTGSQLSEAKGSLAGKIQAKGRFENPEISGNLIFLDAGFRVTSVDNYFTLNDQKIRFDNKGIYFSSVTLVDSSGQKAIIDGTIYTEGIRISKFDLDVKLNRFQVIDTEQEKDALFYGRVILSSTTKITGNIALPVVNSRTKLIDGSYLTVIVPMEETGKSRGEGVVRFYDADRKISPILTREEDNLVTKSDIRGLDLTANIEIDKNSTLKILMDPYSGDSLVINGDAALSFGIDPGGNTTLTGTYVVSKGKYRVSLEGLVKKDFSIKSGSTIMWNGTPVDATVNIEAELQQRAAPIDLVAGQIGGLTEQERNKYLEALPFLVILKMSGPLLHPDLSFKIDLPPGYRGAMGGVVYAKLNQLNSNPSEVNKQVFALLVLGRFIQEDPFASSGGGSGLGAVARTSVSKFLSNQLNRLSQQYINAFDVNFDLQSYDDYSSGTAETRTELGIQLRKQLFNERLTVSVGSNVDLSEGNKQNSSSELASDVTVEYKLGDGTYRLKAFRQNQHEDIIEGPLNVTGVGLIYIRDFDEWKDLFRKEEEETITPPLKEN